MANLTKAGALMANGSLPTEQWRSIPGYEDYEVSNLGRVRSLKPHSACIMKPSFDAKGYGRLVLSMRGVGITHKVHRLVAQAFCERKEGKNMIRHLDGNSRNNAATNLAWGTAAENNEDTIRLGTNYWANRTHCRKGHEWTPENTRYQTDGSTRSCRTCNLEANRRWKAARRASA